MFENLDYDLYGNVSKSLKTQFVVLTSRRPKIHKNTTILQDSVLILGLIKLFDRSASELQIFRNESEGIL